MPLIGELRGRVAVVTGSGRNIGRAIALALAQRGAAVVVNGHHDAAALDAVVAEIAATGGRALAVKADVGQDAEVARLVATAVEHFGGVDIAVSNVALRRYRSFLEITPEEWDDVLRTNLSACFYLARHTLPHMAAGGWGRIVNISGFDGFWGHVTHRAHNVTAKAGMHGLSKALAREFGSKGITVNTVAPGAIDTARDWSQYPHQEKQRLEAEIPLGRFGATDEVAAAVAFLASDQGGFVSGQVIHVNGGHHMY